MLVAATAHGQWRAHVEAAQTRARLEAAQRAEAQKARETAQLLARHAEMTEEAAALRTSQAETAEYAQALRAQIASLVERVVAADSRTARERDLRRTLRERDSQLAVLTRAVVTPELKDDSPNPFVIERQVRRLSGPLRACFAVGPGLVRLPHDPGADCSSPAAAGSCAPTSCACKTPPAARASSRCCGPCASRPSRAPRSAATSSPCPG